MFVKFIRGMGLNPKPQTLAYPFFRRAKVRKCCTNYTVLRLLCQHIFCSQTLSAQNVVAPDRIICFHFTLATNANHDRECYETLSYIMDR